VKISVSLPDEDVAFLDEYAKSLGVASRSAVVQRAVRLLRATELGPAYAEAWAEWESEGAADAWDATVGDGLEPPGQD
jgi:Arc/MetJ-type ribon-helix-helix transcriptional regulator